MKFIKHIWSLLRRPSARYSAGALMGIGLLIGTISLGGIKVFFDHTNTLEFCTSCHEMAGTVYDEYKESVHYQNSSGVRAECPDCHVPKEFGPMLRAKMMAVKDIWHTMLGTVDTEEKFEANRWKMASRVWAYMEATDSATCRSCHDFQFMDMSEQPRLARRKHNRAMDEGKTCIDCHKGIVHSEPMEPDEDEDEDEEEEGEEVGADEDK